MRQTFAVSLMIGTALGWSTTDCFAQQRQGGAPPCTIPLPACAADIAPPGGERAANVQDLLAVISTFGQNGVPTNERPQGDCAPLPNGDCVVDVLDLLAVINSWGACAPRLPCGLPGWSADRG